MRLSIRQKAALALAIERESKDRETVATLMARTKLAKKTIDNARLSVSTETFLQLCAALEIDFDEVIATASGTMFQGGTEADIVGTYRMVRRDFDVQERLRIGEAAIYQLNNLSEIEYAESGGDPKYFIKGVVYKSGRNMLHVLTTISGSVRLLTLNARQPAKIDGALSDVLTGVMLSQTLVGGVHRPCVSRIALVKADDQPKRWEELALQRTIADDDAAFAWARDAMRLAEAQSVIV